MPDTPLIPDCPEAQARFPLALWMRLPALGMTAFIIGGHCPDDRGRASG